MIFIEHENEIVTSTLHKGEPIIHAIYKIAASFPGQGIVCFKKGLEKEPFLAYIATNHKALLVSSANELNVSLGYVEDGPFIKLNNKVCYPTWIKGTAFLFLHAALINMLNDQLDKQTSFLYWINSLSKLTQSQGVFSYQAPVAASMEAFTTVNLYKFVKQHYKTRWTFLLLLCHIWYERRFPLYAFAKAQCSKRRHLNIDIASLQQSMLGHDIDDLDYDVIIPTMGRAAFLHDVIIDLSKQLVLPKKVIIVEQNADLISTTDLQFLNDTTWPFEIIHKFINKTGACNARNLAIGHTTASWILLFDDDARLQTHFSKHVQVALQRTNAKAMTFAYLQKGEKELQRTFKQWESFGSGCSIVHRDVIEKCSFDMALEHGYGEDVDYGMQIRNAGYDVIYAPQIQIVHLKAPVGGFRKPHIFPWASDAVQPKPSPQIMYHRTKNYSKEQLLGYKMVLFFKFYKSQSIKNPFVYFLHYRKMWIASLTWAKTLNTYA